MPLSEPLHFTPYLKPVLWGGSRIPAIKGIAGCGDDIGESWEISVLPDHVSTVDRGEHRGATLTDLVDQYGEELLGAGSIRRHGRRFPLLIKLIEARHNLSLQVHPGDDLASERHGTPGKSELWHIIDAAPASKIYLGLRQQLDPESFSRRVAENTIMDAVERYDAAPGDNFLIPAGRIHAIGAGVLLAEIQQSSDLTYRIYDYGRRDAAGNTRPLHIDEARDAIDYKVLADYRLHPAGNILADYNCFEVKRIEIGADTPVSFVPGRDSFTVVMNVGGVFTVDYCGGSVRLGIGDTLLFPASLPPLAFRGCGTALTAQA